MTLLYCGIDEAGYGPMLGPLTVGLSCFRIEGWREGDPPPNLWSMLGRAVTDSARHAATRIPIADSKKLKLPNSGKRHPCAHLERAPHAALTALNQPCGDDAELVRSTGSMIPAAPWYAGEPIPLPLARSADEAKIDANLLGSALTAAGVAVAALRCRITAEDEFNETVRATGSKAETTTAPLASLLNEAVAMHDGPIRIICDRQSGRLDYNGVLAHAFPDEPIALDARTERASRYLLRDGRVAIHFETGSEERHLPAALASMTAKLVRELMMHRFNRHFGARRPGLRPTAGYVQDARRWLGDTRDLLTDDERRQIVRIA